MLEEEDLYADTNRHAIVVFSSPTSVTATVPTSLTLSGNNGVLNGTLTFGDRSSSSGTSSGDDDGWDNLNR